MKKMLLIIDDQLSTRKLLSHYLGHFFEVIEMDNAAEAISWLGKGHRPSAIVADIMMPEMSGIEFLKKLNHKNDAPPVIMLSSVESSVEKMNCFNLGAKDYVVKPFNPEELCMRINNLIKN